MAWGKCETTGKTMYSTRRAARSALDSLMARRAGHKTERTAYPCRFCKQWHLSSMGDKPEHVPRLAPAKRWHWDGKVGDDEHE